MCDLVRGDNHQELEIKNERFGEWSDPAALPFPLNPALKLKPQFHFARHVTSRLDTTQLDTFDVSSPCILACRTAQLDTLDPFDTMSATGVTRNLVCCVTCITFLICKLFTDLLEYTLI